MINHIKDSSHITCLQFFCKTSGIILQTNECMVLFGGKFNFKYSFSFFPDRHTLKFLKVKCIPPTDKKPWPDEKKNLVSDYIVLRWLRLLPDQSIDIAKLLTWFIFVSEYQFISNIDLEASIVDICRMKILIKQECLSVEGPHPACW